MKFTVQTILSLPVDGASSHLLIFGGDVKILLDCGIPHSFDLTQYTNRANELRSVSLVLISHSSLQYSGAMCFLMEELGLNPKIFYTTQPIMRYSPLNIHEQLLILRYHGYGKKVFNKIYKNYESIQIVKPHQKKFIDLTTLKNKLQENEGTEMEPEVQQSLLNISQSEKVIYFQCFAAGGSLGSIAWRINYGIVNILYLVEYNNYSLYHINGLDLDSILQPTDILITDTYRQLPNQKLKKQHLYEKVKSILTQFNNSCLSENSRSRNMSSLMMPQTEKKLLITCYPSQILIELMAVLKKIMEETQQQINRDKVKVIHLSSRFLQLIKSQIDCFSQNFKDTLQKIDQFFIQTKTLGPRINIATIHSINGILNQCIDNNVTIYHLGNQIKPSSMAAIQSSGIINIGKMKLMQMEEKIPSSAIIEEKEQMVNEEEEEKQQKQVSEFHETEVREKEKSSFMGEENQFNNANQMIQGKYFSQIGFPHFVSQYPEEEHDYDDYGIRHHYEKQDNRKNIEDYRKEEMLADIPMEKKSSRIDVEIMNIQFKLLQTEYKPFQSFKIKFLNKVLQRTNFHSSLQLITTLKPRNIIFINTYNKDPLCPNGDTYKGELRKSEDHKEIKVFDMSKKIIHVELQNELVSYKMNYIQIPTQVKLQKVKGLISYKNGFLEIHLDCLGEKQILEFRMQKFYKMAKLSGDYDCVFTGNGIIIDGVRLYRQENKVILEGNYSEEYFKVRKLLYDFLKLL